MSNIDQQNDAPTRSIEEWVKNSTNTDRIKGETKNKLDDTVQDIRNQDIEWSMIKFPKYTILKEKYKVLKQNVNGNTRKRLDELRILLGQDDAFSSQKSIIS